jgi:acetolactate synthase-1/2/3 large subunit
MPLLTGAQALVQSLKVQGVDTLFALPGVQLDHVFEALYQERAAIRVLNSRHEQGAAYMAYGYAESTGRLGSYLVVPGPGLLNTATALCTAHSSNAPVLALTGQISSKYIGRGLGILHELANPAQMLAPVTKHQVFADTPARVATGVAEAVRVALSGRQGPVLFEVPDNVTVERGEVTIAERARREPDPRPDASLIEKAAALLGAAKRPAIIAGGGAYGAEAELQALAEALQAPVIMTRHGRGALSDRHPLAQTLLAGHMLWAEVDVAIAVGTRFLEGDAWGADARLKTIRIDVDGVQADKPTPADIKIVSSARVALAALKDALPSASRESRKAEMLKVKEAALAKWAALEPQKAWSDALRAGVPEEGRIVYDITQIGFYSWMGLPAYGPRTLIYPGYQDSLGYGYATALGVKVAHPDKPVVAVCGDGGFMFTMPEMATAVQHGINLVAVVFNDGGFGNVRRTQKLQFGEHYLGSDLRNPDFMALAKAFGMIGMKAESPKQLGELLPKAFAANAPVLIEAPVGPMPAWQPLMPRGRAR